MLAGRQAGRGEVLGMRLGSEVRTAMCALALWGLKACTLK